MKKTIKSFVEDFSLVARWFYPQGQMRSIHEVEAMYQTIQTMWFDHRELFPNKGTYKTVRRLFIKHTAELYLEARFQGKISLYEMSPELLQEMRFKSRQGWLSKSTFYWIRRCIIEDNYPVRDTAKREKLLRML